MTKEESKEREKILRYWAGTEGEETAAHLVDLATEATRRKFGLSGFLDPFGQEIAETVAKTMPGISVRFEGGYQGAERQRAMFKDQDFLGEPSYEIAMVEAKWKVGLVRLSHRDVLGAVMGLGIKRDVIGDIIAGGEKASIICTAPMADYLVTNLNSIGASRVQTEIGDIKNILPKEESVKDISATVASMRVDAVAAAGFGMSRSKVAKDIAEGKLKLNWQEVKSPSDTVKEGDTLSMRGRGRLEVSEVRGSTKKGRIALTLSKRRTQAPGT